MEVSYTIQMAAKISGVGVHTIRAWEKRYKAIVPKRDIAGHRVYSKEDIEKLRLLSDLCLLGYSISKIAHQTISELKEQLKILGKNQSDIKNLIELQDRAEEDYSQLISIILLALKNYKLDVVSNEVGKLKMAMNARSFALNVVLPIMTELNNAIVKKEYSISHEHALSAILKYHIGHILYKEQKNLEQGYLKIVFCGIEQDYHEFGILMGALLAKHYQFKMIYLGPNLPASSLCDAMKFLEANMVVIGATSVVTNLGKNYIQYYVEQVAKGVSEQTDVIVGTNIPFSISENLQKKVKQIENLYDFDQFLSSLH